MIWHPPLFPRAWSETGKTLVLLSVFAYLAVEIAGDPVRPAAFFLGVLAVGIVGLLGWQVYRLLDLLSLRYVLSDRTVSVHFASARLVVPLTSLFGVNNATDLADDAPRSLLSRLLGRWHWQETGRFTTSRSRDHLALLVTSTGTFVVSPADRDGFVAALAAMVERASPSGIKSPQLYPSRWAVLPVWSDRLAHVLLAAGLVGVLALFGYVFARYASLPPFVPLHYNILGEADFVGTRAEVFKLPAIGTIIFLANAVLGSLVHSVEKVVAYLLFAMGIVAQLALLVAIIRILTA